MVLTADEVRQYISDTAVKNLLMDNEQEFSDLQIEMAKELAISHYDSMPPMSMTLEANFPSKAVLLYGVLAKLYEGQVALSARNNLSYSDGGVTLPLEEKYPMYIQLANQYLQMFENHASRIKVQLNMESGWGEVGSDYSRFPTW